MQLEVGSIVEGKVTSITKFGAFLSLPSGRSGLVHISEVSSSYVNDVSEHLSMGQTVNVKIIDISQDGKINLSIKKAQPRPEGNFSERSSPRAPRAPRPNAGRQDTAKNSAPPSFEDKLKQFMQDSDSKISTNKMYSQQKKGPRRRKD